MTEPIFPSPIVEPEEVPTYFIANPVRVQLPTYQARQEGRRSTQMDLVALATNILEREKDTIRISQQLVTLSAKFTSLEYAVTQLKTTVAALSSSGAPQGKVGRILNAIESILNDDDIDPEDDEDDGTGTYEYRRY